jgi:hypothetical protein
MRAGEKPGQGGQENGVPRCLSGGDADHQTAGGNQSIVGAKYGGAKPADILGAMTLGV